MSLEFQQRTLDNGLTIIGEHNPRAQSFAAGYFVKTGSRDETADISGVSHFLEHMMFKGTDRRSADEINREFDELGANYNAYTSEERTVYYGAVLTEQGPQLLDLLTDMMRPALRQEDFDIEKNVILEEIAMYEDRPNFKVFDDGNQYYYGDHPLGNSVLGSVSSITALAQEQMLEYFERRYAPNNLLLTVAGNYDWEKVLAQVSELTAQWRRQETPRLYPELHSKAGLHRLTSEKLNRAHIAIYAPGLGAQDPARYAAALVSNCLGDSSGSRLYWALIDKGLADAASLSHHAADQAGSFMGYLSTDPERVDEVLSIYEEVLQQGQRGLDEAEWLQAQRKLATGITLRGETPFGRLMSLGSSFQYNHSYLSVQDVVDRVMAATISDAAEILAARPFDRMMKVVLRPS